MKISKIHIHNFYQFQNLELDLTYPQGHEKEGMPLDKVCLIGQSGTGKTTLLELMKTFGININSTPLDHSERQNFSPIRFKPYQKVAFHFSTSESPIIYHVEQSHTGHSELMSRNVDFFEILRDKLIYFPSGLSNISLGDGEKFDNSKFEEDEETYKINRPPYYFFDKKTLESLWESIYQEVRNYQVDEANYRIQLTRRAEEDDTKIDIKAAIQDWKKQHPNPLKKIAVEFLDKVLNKFHLSVKTDLDDVRKTNVLQIFSHTSDSVVPYEKLSSGTRQIIYTAFPIYQLIEDSSLILIDQPEDSLYPDVQKEIISYYTSFDKNKTSQFFFATHSPIIASSFEPWEVVELKFNKEGKIYRELYYDDSKENHVDNYHTDPRYLRWDGILTDVFDLKTEGNEEFRSKMLVEYSELKKKIRRLEKEGKLSDKSPDTHKIVAQYIKVGKLLGWETK